MKSDDGFDTYERRRIKLQELVDSYGSQKALSEKVGIAESVISRMLYPAGKKHKRNIGEKSVSMIEESLQLPRGTLDGIVGSTTTTHDEIEFAGKIRLGSVPVVGEAILGVDGMIDMVEIRAGWLQIYSSDNDAYGLKVKGDSMHPRIQSGEFVVIEPNTHIHSGDEVFVRTLDGHNMIKVMTKTRDGSYQFSSINNEHKPITLDPSEVEKMHFVSAIVKATRYVDYDEVQSKRIDSFNSFN
ncbi:TPA: helix-turn-helix transcriptional regulator [Yersinia enterocolitica]